ncbi:MAG: DUF4339 domain-containing protein [Verrucomicrobiales bacterium]|nr:DUF4339 domain-containing protein [Verrucomicrobiales bacterium]
MQWYHLDDNGDQIAVDEEQLVAMVESGQLGSENLLWREDFDEWLTCGNVFPDAFSEKETEPKKPRLLMGDAVPAYTQWRALASATTWSLNS